MKTLLKEVSRYNKEYVEQNRALRPIEITKVTKWTDAENVVGFTLTLLASQFIIASGWIIFGKFLGQEIYGISILYIYW